jgi:Protein of unknown function (DUF4246)
MFESSNLVGNEIRDSMKVGIELLERFPQWSPASSPGIDLVDPMLYSLIQHDSSLCGSETGPKKPSRTEKVTTQDYMRSTKYAVLPSDVEVDTEGTARFTSYIHNIHPELDAGLYSAIGKLLSRHLPMLESTLSQLGQDSSYSTGITHTESVEGSGRKLLGRKLQIITRIQTIKLVSALH